MVYIREALPNPAGEDSGNEWIKIVNDGEVGVDITGWSLKDLSGKEYFFSTVINKKTELVIKNDVSKITLNNDGDTIFLVSNNGEIKDTLVYEKASDDEIIVTERFLKEEIIEDSGEVIPEINAKEGFLLGGGLAVVLTAMTIAAVGSVAVGMFLKKKEKNENV